MTTNSQNLVSEELLNAAACDALGATPPADTAAYLQQLAAAGPEALQADRELRAAVAQLAAASPYMKPSADLRGKILQATAPKTFRMEDYRRANHDTGRFYRWGFAAALLFLVAGAWYNMNLKNNLTASIDQSKSLASQLSQRDLALKNIIDPATQQVSLLHDGKLTAKAFVDDKTQTAVIILPEGAAPPNASPQLTLTRNNAAVHYQTILVTAPRSDFPDAAPNFDPAIFAHDLQPTTPKPAFRATLGQ